MQRPPSESLPLTPGVYMYKDAGGRIIYVGKARVLRRRVLSYFREDGLPHKTLAMLRHAVTVNTLSTTTEKEALLLEASLIKKHRPRYNIVLRDDKQYVLFRIAIAHAFPRMEIVRQARRDKARYFGPFTSATAARETWKLLHGVFPLRRCTDRAMRNRSRPCLYYHLHQCPAPCGGHITSDAYHQGLRKIMDIPSGKSRELLSRLKDQMLAAAAIEDFEQAARVRDQLYAVQKTVEKQAAVLPAGGDRDIIGLHVGEHGLALGILFVRGGMLLDGRTFFWSGLQFEDAPELLWAFPLQFYGTMTPPPHIVLPWLPPPPEENSVESIIVLEQTLADMRGGPVRIMAARSMEENSLVDMAATNAREETRRRRENPLEDSLAHALHCGQPIHRVECVDVSHTAGQQTRVGLVVFEDGAPLSSAYRTYTMPDGTGDDYGTLAAWVARRVQSGPPWPDVLLIDGGKGQLAVVERALREAGAEGYFALAAIAKARDDQGRADRRAGNVADRIFLPQRSNPLPLREGSTELLFLQHVRDTTHRYTIGRHRKARGAAALSSELTRLQGIGAHTARLLWDHFGSVEAMAKASKDELQTIQGIGVHKAAALATRLQSLVRTHKQEDGA